MIFLTWLHYFSISLFSQMVKYLEFHLIGDLVDHRSDEEKEQLMAGNEDIRRRIERLLTNLDATKQALNIVNNLNTAKRNEDSEGGIAVTLEGTQT